MHHLFYWTVNRRPNNKVLIINYVLIILNNLSEIQYREVKRI